jgi:hypothetical protein
LSSRAPSTLSMMRDTPSVTAGLLNKLD